MTIEKQNNTPKQRAGEIFFHFLSPPSMEGGDDSLPPSAASPPWHGDHAGASDPDPASGPEDIAEPEFHDLLTEEEQHHTDLNHDLDHDHDDDHEHAPEPETTDVSFDDLKLKIIKQRLSRDHSVIAAALQESSVLVVSSDGKRVKRVNPFRFKESRDHKLYTVLVENLPEDHSKDNLQRIFREAGNIRRISIYDPRSAAESTKHKQETFFSSKLHALVEYDTIESAEKAVALLNDEQDWRNGMRVKLLKKMGKYGHKKQAWKVANSEKNSSSHVSEQTDEENHSSNELHEDTHDEEDGDHLAKDNKGGHRPRSHGRSRKQKYRAANGIGHGSTSSTHVMEAPKPPPGPKMPDGTRGFAMGRGRPPVPAPN
ncbi:hypothetical protein Ahy_A10g051338 isoform C [Arachis hypogaea]|uniref:RRM domain-containing protein n=1 Tax=Arachis hypogaea TaxID=3818 RepID=A0A445BCF0_ARAHY|nr:hypothetical protein Ahy_A10g051338 isoform C [Arachis hypogaea]